MRAFFLRTCTSNCEIFWRSWACLGNTYHTEAYDDRPHDRHKELVETAKELRPDVIVYIGAIEKYHRRPVPQPDIFKQLRDVAPSVHICCDASDKPWWEWLIEYEEQGCFSSQVSIDGSFDTPIADFKSGLVKLAPNDPSLFSPKAWDQRGIQFGMAGGIGHTERTMLLTGLISLAGLTWRNSDRPFEEMARFMGDCKLIVNYPGTGSGESVHVKARVTETAWAGACLLEKDNACTSHWFPDDMYLKYTNLTDAIKQVTWAREHDAEIKDKAERFHKFVWDNHHPRVFWRDVLTKAGVHENVAA